MRVPRIYTDQDLAENSEVILGEAPSHHLLKVLRMDLGRALTVFNGRATDNHHGQFAAALVGKTKKNATIAVGEFHTRELESPLKTHLAAGISRGDRFDLVLQKASELGVSTITPLFTERTEIKLNAERLEKKHHAWRKIMIGACEQSGRCSLPQLNTAIHFEDFIDTHSDELKFVLHHRSEQNFTEHEAPTSVTLLIGPEGGLAEGEISRAIGENYQPLRLGPRVMRTETAPIAALAILQHRWGDL